MNSYCLTIKVRSRNEALLNNLLVTVETLNDKINEIEMLELFTATDASDGLATHQVLQIEPVNREIFLDCWMINEE